MKIVDLMVGLLKRTLRGTGLCIMSSQNHIFRNKVIMSYFKSFTLFLNIWTTNPLTTSKPPYL